IESAVGHARRAATLYADAFGARHARSAERRTRFAHRGNTGNGAAWRLPTVAALVRVTILQQWVARSAGTGHAVGRGFFEGLGVGHRDEVVGAEQGARILCQRVMGIAVGRALELVFGGVVVLARRA